MPAVDFLPRRLYNAFAKTGFSSDPLKGLIALQGNPEYVSVWDDFTGTRSGTWPAGTDYASTVGTGTEVIGITQAVGGTMTLTTGTGGSDTAGQGYGLNWSGDRGFYYITRLKMATRITNAKFETGMTDSVSDDGAVATKATPTFTATDCAIAVFDTADNSSVSFVSNGGSSDADADWGGTLASNTYIVVEMVGKGPTDTTGDNVACYINGALVGSGNIGGDAPLTPWWYIEDLAQSAATTLTVDYWGCVGPRVAQWGVST
jgi:hypothetical protein|tara:strand:- start:1783 stop:2565 length:783 start_codon:yes stop_codon:yes gene_type:complete